MIILDAGGLTKQLSLASLKNHSFLEVAFSSGLWPASGTAGGSGS